MASQGDNDPPILDPKAHKATYQRQQKENSRNNRRGEIAVAKQVHWRAPKHLDKKFPLRPGFMNVSVVSANAAWGSLSPMKLGPIHHEETLRLTPIGFFFHLFKRSKWQKTSSSKKS
jgi:hypothetical protein